MSRISSAATIKLTRVAKPVAASVALGLIGALAGSPALAAGENPFHVNFAPANGSTENTGSTAQATFTVGKSGSNVFLDILLDNTSDYPSSPINTTTLVGMFFKKPNYLTRSSYDPNGTAFTEVYDGGKLSGGPFGGQNTGVDFICIRSTSPAQGCNGGSPTAGLTKGVAANVPVKFIFSNSDSSKTESDIVAAFQQLFSTPANIGARFQQITCTTTACAGSDKVAGNYTPPRDSVPGPVPIFGAAAAFGYSRKLRGRLRAMRAIG